MFDANKLLGRVLDGGAASGFVGGVLGGGAVGLLGSKKGRKFAKSALKIGGVAAVGALAYHAYTRYRANQAGAGAQATPPSAPSPSAVATSALAPPPPESGFVPSAGDAVQSMGLTLIRSMIAAAKADGEIDAEESRRLFAQMESSDLDPEERSFLLQELSKPVDLDAIVAVASTPEIAAEIYVASLMAIEVSNPAENAYLQLLASRLNLDPALAAELQRSVEQQTVATT